jgi:hypothetical protein
MDLILSWNTMHNKLLTLFLFIILSFSFTANGQKQVNSPYARFNLGNYNPSGSFRSLSMGGTGTAMRDNSSIYFVNPASYSSLDTTSFLFDFGINYTINVLNNGTEKTKSDDNNFDHILMGFPVAKNFGIVAGLIPLTDAYYNVSQTISEGDSLYDPLIGEMNSVHRGTGGLSSFFIGTGFNITKNLSLGANFTTTFGKIERANQFDFLDYANTFGIYSSKKLRIVAVNFDFGAQYNVVLKKDHFFTAGIAWTSSKKYKSELETITERYAQYSTSLYSPDTLSYSKVTTRDSTKTPQTFRIGLAYGKTGKFTVGIDYVATPWSNAALHGTNGNLADAKALLVGVEFIPDRLSNTSYLKRVEYRAGGHVANSYLIVNGVQVRNWGVSAGFGIRLRNSMSKANFHFDYTQRVGDFSKGLHNENVYTIGASLNLYDFWFQKKKYD